MKRVSKEGEDKLFPKKKINVRVKGGGGERKICKLFNEVVEEVFGTQEIPKFQRNQNQSAVGGHDITNPYKLAIEVKRQEALNINSWWKQCEKNAQANEMPILIYRQNFKKWRVRLHQGCFIENFFHATPHPELMVVEISMEDFLKLLRKYLICIENETHYAYA